MESVLIDDYDHIDSSILYTPDNIPGKGCDQDLFNYQISSKCVCKNECLHSNVCSCLLLHGLNYENRKLIDAKLTDGNSCLECNNLCSCSLNCGNRVVQFGPIAGLQIKQLDGKGNGIITSSKLLKGQFICEYAGEVIGREEAAERRKKDDHNYIFTLNEFIDDSVNETIIDATCIANIGRYINHSCDPNCKVVPVRVDSVIPKLAIFACRDIDPDEEITYSYGGSTKYDNITNDCKPCLCGAGQCKMFLPYEL